MAAPALPAPWSHAASVSSGSPASVYVMAGAATDAAEVETHRRHAKFLPDPRERVHDLVLQGAADNGCGWQTTPTTAGAVPGRRVFHPRLERT